MPAFIVEFDSNHGPERRLFTLDGDRTLRPQTIQVLEELRLTDRILVGGPNDDLAVYWNDVELDLDRPLETLGVSTNRSLVLRMQPRFAPRAPSTVVSSVDWKAILRPPLEGAIGALLAWAFSSALSDTTSLLSTPDSIDVAVSVLLTIGVGLALSTGLTVRHQTSMSRGFLGVLLSSVAGATTLLGLLTLGRTPSIPLFLVGRVIAWSLSMGLLSLVLRSLIGAPGYPHWLQSAGIGTLVGATSAIIFTLPGSSLLWQALAFITAGLGVGFAAVGYPVWRISKGIDP